MSKVVEFKKPEKKETEAKAEESSPSFDEVMKRNEENRKRQEEDRKKANKGVIRSYRLKH